MALTDDVNTTMLVQPSGGYYGGNGGNNGFFGGDFAWVLLLLVLGGGWGGFGMGGFGGAAMAMDGGFGLYPWLNNSQNINDGFRDQMMNTSINGIQNSINGLSTQLCQCCGDMRYDMSNGFNGVNNSIFGAQTAISQQLNSNELASLNRSFAEQTANMQGFNGVQSGIADLRYTEATEACATRNASAQNTRDIIDSQTRGTQAILDKLCALELDGVKGQLAQAQRENVALQNAVNMATMQASQVQQTADIINGTYTRLSQCPVNSTPVYGNQPIFTCPNNNSCGCNNF